MAIKVLVVEDEAPIRDMLCFILEQHNYTPITVDNYEQCLAKIKEPFPDLILLDWMLPGGSGIGLIKQLKQNELTKRIPIIMLTARDDEADKVKGLEVGADDYIAKPFPPKNSSHVLKP